MPAGTLNETGSPGFICTPFGFTCPPVSTNCSKRLRLHVPLLLGIGEHHDRTSCGVNPVAFGEGVGEGDLCEVNNRKDTNTIITDMIIKRVSAATSQEDLMGFRKNFKYDLL